MAVYDYLNLPRMEPSDGLFINAAAAMFGKYGCRLYMCIMYIDVYRYDAKRNKYRYIVRYVHFII